MDINSILPLLMNKMGGGGASGDLNALLKLTKGEKPDVGEVMNMAMNRRSQSLFGIKEIASFAPDETLGKLLKFFLG